MHHLSGSFRIFQDLFLSKTEHDIRLEQDGHVALMASVDYDEGDEVTKKSMG